MLRFIRKPVSMFIESVGISIHLMLRFITLSTRKSSTIPTFQYISCYGLSVQVLQIALKPKDFNTSHVTVYPYPDQYNVRCQDISIHLMLRFILFHSFWKFFLNIISIHLMLRFIQNQSEALPYNLLISIHLMLRFIVFVIGLESM